MDGNGCIVRLFTGDAVRAPVPHPSLPPTPIPALYPLSAIWVSRQGLPKEGRLILPDQWLLLLEQSTMRKCLRRQLVAHVLRFVPTSMLSRSQEFDACYMVRAVSGELSHVACLERCSLLVELLNERKPLSALSLEPAVAVSPMSPPPCSYLGPGLPRPSSPPT